jgi:hypothetical protein
MARIATKPKFKINDVIEVYYDGMHLHCKVLAYYYSITHEGWMYKVTGNSDWIHEDLIKIINL